MSMDSWTEEIVEYGELDWTQPEIMLNINRHKDNGWVTKILLHAGDLDEQGELRSIELTAYEARGLANALVRVAEKLEELAERDGVHPTRHWRSPIIDAEQYARHPSRGLPCDRL